MFKISAREFTRHALQKIRLQKLLTSRRQAAGRDTGHLALSDRTDVFSYIYEHDVWTSGGLPKDADLRGSRSGLGSELSATDGLRRALSSILDELSIQTLLDVGCGDFSWMQHVPLAHTEYVGIDIVPSVIRSNAEKYGTGNRRFLCLDAISKDLPQSDAIICREVLFHLSLDDASALVEKLLSSGARYVFMTSDASTSFNADIKTGDYRVLNLQKRPFNLPDAWRWINDDDVIVGRSIGVWRT